MIIRPSSRIDKVQTYYFATKLAEIANMKAEGKDVINLGIGSPDMDAPKSVLEVLKASTCDPKANEYQSYKGIPELRKAFASWYKKNFNVDVNPDEEVLPLIGSKEGIMHISMAFLDEGDEVLVPNPGYPAYKMCTLLAGGTPVFYNLMEENNWQVDIEELKKSDLSKVKIMWINYPHMPTGAKGDRMYFAKLIEFVRENNILLCHDNPYGFILNDEPMSLLEIDGWRDCALELNSLSKVYNMAGWRVGTVLAAKPYIDAIMKFKSNMDSGMYYAVQKAAVEALNYGKEWYKEINEVYEQRRTIVWKIMDMLQCSYDEEAVGLFVWAKVPERIKDVKTWVDQILHESLVFITPGMIFGSNGDRYIRIALCSTEKVFQEALQRVEKFVIKTESIA